jgi:hypothetical protein
MPVTGREEADEALAAALAAGKNFTQAGKVVGVCQRTVRRRLDEPEFRALVNRLKSELVESAVALLGKSMNAAASELAKLLKKSKDEKIRLAAAREILNTGLKARQVEEIERQLADLTARLDAMAKGKEKNRGR